MSSPTVATHSNSPQLHVNTMTVERALRLMAGSFVLISLALGYWVSSYWYLFTGFVGINLLQSGFTNWCPAMFVLKKLGLRCCVTSPAP